MDKSENELRFELAKAALSGLLTGQDIMPPDIAARMAVEYADAVLTVLDNTPRQRPVGPSFYCEVCSMAGCVCPDWAVIADEVTGEALSPSEILQKYNLAMLEEELEKALWKQGVGKCEECAIWVSADALTDGVCDACTE